MGAGGHRPSAEFASFLQAVNFFMAGMQAGVGPFLGVLLASRGWATCAIGTVTALGAVAGLVAAAPAGALIDATTRKRACVNVAGLSTVGASALILASRHFWVVASAQAATAIAGARRSSRSPWEWCAKPVSPARTPATRPTTTPVTWPAPRCRAFWAGDSGSPRCSGSPQRSRSSRSPRCCSSPPSASTSRPRAARPAPTTRYP